MTMERVLILLSTLILAAGAAAAGGAPPEVSDSAAHVSEFKPPMTSDEFAMAHGVYRQRRPGLSYMPEDSVNALERYASGNALFQRGAYDSAIVEYTAAIDLMPFEGVYRAARGAAFIAAGEFEEAAHDYTDAMFMFPGRSEYRSGRAAAHVKLGNIGDALADLNRAVQLNPKDPAAYRERGLLYQGAGNERKAIADYKAALRLDPRDAEVKELAGNIRADRRARRPQLPPGPRYIIDFRGGAGLGLYEYTGWSIGVGTGLGAAAFLRPRRLNKFGLAAGAGVSAANYYNVRRPSALGYHNITSIGHAAHAASRYTVDLSGVDDGDIYGGGGSSYYISSAVYSAYVAPVYRVGHPKAYAEFSAAVNLPIDAAAHLNVPQSGRGKEALPVTPLKSSHSFNTNVRMGMIGAGIGWAPNQETGMAGLLFYIKGSESLEAVPSINYTFGRETHDITVSLALTGSFR